MRKSTKFDGAPWAAASDYTKGMPMTGRKTANVMSRNMRRTGGKRGA